MVFAIECSEVGLLLNFKFFTRYVPQSMITEKVGISPSECCIAVGRVLWPSPST